MIETERLLLHPMRSDDREPLLRVFGGLNVMAAFEDAPFDHARDDLNGGRYPYRVFAIFADEVAAR